MIARFDPKCAWLIHTIQAVQHAHLSLCRHRSGFSLHQAARRFRIPVPGTLRRFRFLLVLILKALDHHDQLGALLADLLLLHGSLLCRLLRVPLQSADLGLLHLLELLHLSQRRRPLLSHLGGFLVIKVMAQGIRFVAPYVHLIQQFVIDLLIRQLYRFAGSLTRLRCALVSIPILLEPLHLLRLPCQRHRLPGDRDPDRFRLLRRILRLHHPAPCVQRWIVRRPVGTTHKTVVKMTVLIGLIKWYLHTFNLLVYWCCKSVYIDLVFICLLHDTVSLYPLQSHKKWSLYHNHICVTQLSTLYEYHALAAPPCEISHNR